MFFFTKSRTYTPSDIDLFPAVIIVPGPPGKRVARHNSIIAAIIYDKRSRYVTRRGRRQRFHENNNITPVITQRVFRLCADLAEQTFVTGSFAPRSVGGGLRHFSDPEIQNEYFKRDVKTDIVYRSPSTAGKNIKFLSDDHLK